jgi:hypothetical protein
VPEDAKGRVTRSVLNRINSKSPGSNRGLRSGDQLRWLHISREEQQRGAKEEAGLGWIRYEAPDTPSHFLPVCTYTVLQRLLQITAVGFRW